MTKQVNESTNVARIDMEYSAYMDRIQEAVDLGREEAREEVERLRRALEPFLLSDETLSDIVKLSRDDGMPRVFAAICHKKITDHELLAVRAALAPEQPGTKGERE